VIGAIDQYMTHFAELDLLPGGLQDVIDGVDGHAEGLGLAQKIGHSHQHRLRVRGLWRSRRNRRFFFGDCCRGQSQPGKKKKSKRC
jgi:hypothetical protein